MKYAVIGATGQTGSVVAQTLKQAGHDVRAIVRGEVQAEKMRALGYEAFLAEVDDIAALTRAFSDVDGAYLINPPAYLSSDMFARAKQVHFSLLKAIEDAGVSYTVALSSVGAQHPDGTGNIKTTFDFEQQIKASGLNITILRAPNFLDNWSDSILIAKTKGVLPSFFLPLNKRWPMASSLDIGRVAAELLIERNMEVKMVELSDAVECSAEDVASCLSKLLGQDIQAVEVPTDSIASLFEGKGLPSKSAQGFQEMMHGFNTDFIQFAGEGAQRRTNVDLETAIKHMLAES
ncbi:NmrA family NAD(P)-binding protein [Hydromonas duriensis]|uniref:Uncharacterized protein YbjT (DUF2867 family) n=1 Tax=Hydromonas duriensis TaxID=1527608 RepID=A0A4R6YB27_9BURK|nr:NmrA family NAD(P)-binding protein [Hydromonas duriensis]TDR32813.1 uncharacterized protein YbjT (DUF2867 family) [Hydromonas duriensis]